MAVGIGIVSPQRIDEINILQATYEAMRQAIEKLNPQPAALLNDAVRIPQVAIQQVPIIKEMQKRIHCCSEHCSEGDEGPDDGAV